MLRVSYYALAEESTMCFKHLQRCTCRTKIKRRLLSRLRGWYGGSRPVSFCPDRSFFFLSENIFDSLSRSRPFRRYALKRASAYPVNRVSFRIRPQAYITRVRISKTVRGGHILTMRSERLPWISGRV